MKPKHLLFAVVLIVTSCKVTEKEVIGFYKSKGPIFNTITLRANHTFLYYNFDLHKLRYSPNNADSCHFITRGKWVLIKNKVFLNSYESSFNDTNRIIKISKEPIKQKESNFSFKDVFGNSISFGGVDIKRYHSKQIESRSIVDGFFRNIDAKTAIDDTLIFGFYYFKPLHFITKDSLSSKYVIMLAPYYKQAYFNNKELKVKRNRLSDTSEKFKKIKLVKSDSSVYAFHL